MNLADIARIVAPLKNRIANTVARAVVKIVNDSGGIQIVQLGVLDGEVRDDIERVQNYGFTSVPLEGAEAAVLFVGGRRDHGLAIAVDDRRYRLKGLEDGEVAVYSETGASIVLKSDGSIELTPKSGSDIVLDGGSAEVARKGDATSSGQLSFIGTALVWTPNIGAPVTIGAITGQAIVTPGTPASIEGEITEGAEAVKA